MSKFAIYLCLRRTFFHSCSRITYILSILRWYSIVNICPTLHFCSSLRFNLNSLIFHSSTPLFVSLNLLLPT
nr:MAG TPA: hypothetical protein [Caudoviricetes sp.]DAQ45823.1 MAG TPA: hypothetical protein [Caudoviricetes sp.]